MSCSYIDEHGVVQYPATCMKCKYTNAEGQKATRDVTWRIFYPNCNKINMFCNPMSGAFVASVTVCGQALWS